MQTPHSWFLIAVFAVATSSVACSGGGASTGSPGSGGSSDAAGPAGSGGSGSGGSIAGTGGQADAGPGASGGAGGAVAMDAPGGDDAPAPGDAGMDAKIDLPAPSMTWTGTWASSPQGCGGGFNNQTMREIVHTSIGGNAARVRISNTFSSGPLQIRDVHLAQRTTGSSIDPATDKALLFAGKPDVTIPAGMYAVSDGADFMVKPVSDVAVSFFVVSHNGATCHQSGFQTNYAVGGNMVSAATLNGAQNNGSYFFLSNLDVMNPDAEGAVVTLGASITDGYIAPSDANRRWPNDLAVRLVAGNRVIGVLNQGISGDGVANAVSRFDRDVLSQPNVKWVIFSDNPINDLGNFNPSAQSEIDKIKGMVAKAHDKGIKFLCSTLTPFQNANYWSPQKEPGRTAINAFIRGADSGCDGIIDQDTATHDPANPIHYAAMFNAGDNLHPNVAGLQAIADAVKFDLFK
ncbi:MAG TPA: GDSL-type esterase/lipase family protein [Polyangia bacterium]|nr:GDSL-type esterase/lipase family protein [Polyangia bacterium]